MYSPALLGLMDIMGEKKPDSKATDPFFNVQLILCKGRQVQGTTRGRANINKDDVDKDDKK